MIQRCSMPKVGLLPEQIIELVTEFYCSLTAKKDIDHVVAEIRQFVMHRDPSLSREYLATLLIDYFLRLELRLKTKSQQEWDSMFELSTAQDRACIQLASFPHRHRMRQALRKIKETQLLSTSFQIEMGETQVTDCFEQEIEEDIKVKTKYFFKWCMYLQHAKVYKELKHRDIENLKISQTFNSFGIKFNYFVAWKQFCKKKRLLKQKQESIRSTSRQSLARRCVNKIAEITEIIGIETKLTEKVARQLLVCRQKQAFKKLHNNKIRNRLLTRKFGAENKNLVYYSFLRGLVGGNKPSQGKSFVMKRLECDEAEKRLRVLECFQAIKQSCRQKNHKATLVRSGRKKRNFEVIRKRFEAKNSQARQESKLKEYLEAKKYRFALTVLSFHRLAQEEQAQTLKTISENNSMFVDANMKKRVKERMAQCVKTLSKISQDRFIRALQKRKQDSDTSQLNKFRVDQLLQQRLFRHYKTYQANKATTRVYFASMEEKRLHKMMKNSFRKWKGVKKYNKMENILLEKMNCIHKMAAKHQFWNRLKRQVQEKEYVEEFMDKIMAIINRTVFLRLAGRTVRINKELEKFRAKKVKRSMRMLFNLLVNNSSFNADRAGMIDSLHLKTCQRQLIRNLQSAKLQKNREEQVEAMLQRLRKIDLFSTLKSNAESEAQLANSWRTVGKKIFTNYLMRSCRKGEEVRESLNSKGQELTKMLRKNDCEKFVLRLSEQLYQNEQYQNKLFKTVSILAKRGISGIKGCLTELSKKRQLSECKNRLHRQKKAALVKQLRFGKNETKIKEYCAKSQLNNGFAQFVSLTKLKQGLESRTKSLEELIVSKTLSRFFIDLGQNYRDMQAKYRRLDEITQKRIAGCKSDFIRLTQWNKENICRNQKIIILRVHKGLSELMTTTFRGKFNRMKFNCSLKNYARHLLRKGFKGLKKSHVANKEKENMAKMEKSSYVIMEKSIEKSFKSNTLSEQIQRFNLRKSKHIPLRAL